MRNLLSFLRTQGAAFVVFNLIVGAISMSLLGCGGGSSSQPVTVTVTASASNVDGADKITVSATVANDKAGGGVTWTLSGVGALSGNSSTSVTYTAPAATSSAQTATITATSVSDSTKAGSASITIPAAPAVTTSSLTAGAVGSSYSQALVVTGGIPPYKWALASGTLPSCISIVTSGNNTTLTGTPNAACAGTYPNISFTVTDSGTPTALTATTAAFTLTIGAAPAISFGAATLPAGILNTSYTGSVTASGGAGALTYGLSAGSSLPTGLTLSAAGAITGTPTTAGTKSFTVVAADGFGDSATQTDSITVNYPTLTVTAATLGTGYVGTNYSQTLAATGGSGTGYTWTLSGGTSLPAGLSLSGPGAITGKPTTAGTTNFIVQVKDSANNTATGNFSITVKAAVSVTTNSPLPAGYVGANYSQALSATGGSGSGYTWALNSGSSLPTGISLSSSGAITGKPTVAGTTSFGVTVTDSVGNTATATLSILVNGAVAITSEVLPNGYPGTAYPGTTLAATGGSGSGYQWSWAAASASSLPSGLSLSSVGVITGTPANATNTSVTSNIVVTVTDSASNTATANFSITIDAALTITNSGTLAAGYVGSNYSRTLTAAGGSGSGYTMALTGGTTLPAGLTLSGGTISGKPTAAGTTNFKVLLTDGASNSATTNFSITVNAGVSISTATTLPAGYVNNNYSQSLAASGGSGTGYTWAINAGSSLPNGLTLSGSVLSGKPTAIGSSSFGLTVTDSVGNTSTATFSVTINPGISITPPVLPAGYNGASYGPITLGATGGSGSGLTWNWAAASGSSLPSGLSISSGGVISGTASNATNASVSSNVVISVSDSAGNSGSYNASITIEASVAISTGTSLPTATVNAPYSVTLAGTGGNGVYTWSTNNGGTIALQSMNLSLSTAGVISGTPSSTGTISVPITLQDGQSHISSNMFTITATNALTVTTSTLPLGYTNAAYSQTLAAAGGSGSGYTWTTTGASNLATFNLSLSAGGVLSGTPASTGTVSFTAKVTDSANNTATQAFSFVIDAPLSITTSSTLPSGYNGLSYSQALAATGGSGSGYTWALANGTSLPTGLNLSGSSISGTPTVTGTANFTLKVTDSVGGSKTSNFSITVKAGVSITTGATLPVGYANLNYSQTLAATGGSGTGFTWTLNSGSTLPSGITLSSGGLLSGKALVQSSSSFGITVTDSVGNTATATFSLTIRAGITITPPSLAVGYNGASYGPATFAASGGSGSGQVWSWVAASGSSLPGGLSISTSGVVSGIASNVTNASVTSNVVVSVSDSAGNTATYNASITIEATLAITNSATLPNGVVNNLYTQQLAATGGNGSYTWAISNASNMDNLTLSNTGLLTGTPTTAPDTATFTATVTDGQSHTASVNFTVNITNALTITTPGLPIGYSGVSYSQTLTAAGGTGTGYTWSTTGASNLGTFNLTLSSAGLVSGTPSSTGTVSFTAKVTDSANSTATQSYSFNINQPLSIPLANPNPWPSGTVNQSYSGVISASGGSGVGYTWTINGATVSGGGISLGDNLTATVNGSNQLTVNGTPNAIQSVALNNVQAQDSLGNLSGTVSYSIQINSAGSQVSGQIFINSCNVPSYPVFTVKLMQGATIIQTATTNSGNYSFNGVQNGTYSIVPSISGASSVFYPATITNVVVNNSNVSGENFNANTGVTVSGTVSYAGSKTGQVYLVLSNSCGGSNPNGTSITDAQLLSGGAFTIRGVPPGNYTLTAGMDMFGQGSPNALDPAGSSSVSVGTSNVTNAAVTMVDPTVATPGSGPKLGAISPTNLGVVINYGAITNNNKEEDVAGYTVQWSTSTTFTATSSYSFAANGTKAPVWILHNGLTGMTGSFSNGTTYYFRARGEMPGGVHTPWTYYGSQASPTGVTVGALAASGSTWTVSGSVTVPGTVTPSGPLYVGFFNQSNGQAYAAYIASPSNVSANAYSFNVPNTSASYFFFAIMDQNNNGLIDVGDVTNTGDNNSGSVTVTGNVSGQNLTLPATGSDAVVTTGFFKQINQSGTSSNYNLNFDVRGQIKLPVAVALTAGSNLNVVLPVDIGACYYCGNPQFQSYSSIGSTKPNVGDTYTFSVTYSDGSTGTVVGTVTAVLTGANAVTNMAPSGNSSNSTTPTFTWTYPANPSNYTYQFYMNDNNGNTVWQIPGNNSNLNGFPSTVPNIVWGTDPTGDGSNTPNVPSLTTGATYYWQLQSIDANGNQAAVQVYYIP